MSKRYVKSSKRKALVKSVKFGTSNAKSVMLGAQALTKDKNSLSAVDVSGESTLNFTISSGDVVYFQTSHNKKAVKAALNLKFK